MAWDKLAFERFYCSPSPWGNGNPAHQTVRLHYCDFWIGQGQRELAVNLRDAGITGWTVIIGAGFGWTCEGLRALGVEAVGTDTSEWIQSAKNTTEEADIRDWCMESGVDPDTDEILGPPNHPAATLKIPDYKQAQWDARIQGPEYAQRIADGLKVADGPKPEWMIKPLDLFMTRIDRRCYAVVMPEGGISMAERGTIARKANGAPQHIVSEELLNSVNDAEALGVCDMMESLKSERGGTGCECFHILSPFQDPTRQRKALNWKSYGDWRTFLDGNGFQSHKIIPSVSFDGVLAYSVI